MSSLRGFLSVVTFTLLLSSACSELGVAPLLPCAREHVCVTGTVRFFSFEGGFWAVRGDDRVTYDPVGGLPTAFREDGLRVYLVARERRDLVSFHMAGPMVDIVSLQRLP
jgi:hypothetical protein